MTSFVSIWNLLIQDLLAEYLLLTLHGLHAYLCLQQWPIWAVFSFLLHVNLMCNCTEVCVCYRVKIVQLCFSSRLTGRTFTCPTACLYLAENLICLPEGRKDWNSTNIVRSFCIYNAQCVKPSQPWPGRSTASSMWWISSCRWSCRPFPCWHTATPAATGTSWTHRLPPCWWDEMVFDKLTSWCVSATFPSRLILTISTRQPPRAAAMKPACSSSFELIGGW